MRTGIYPGSFDPITNGHLDVIKRSAQLVERLFVAIAKNPNKTSLFTIEERIAMIQEAVKGFPNIEVGHFDGLLVDYAKRKKATILIKGLRAVSDFEYEFQMALVNRGLEPAIETIFLMTDYKYAFLSSSLVKEIASLGGTIEMMVPKFVEKKLKEKFKAGKKISD